MHIPGLNDALISGVLDVPLLITEEEANAKPLRDAFKPASSLLATGNLLLTFHRLHQPCYSASLALLHQNLSIF